MSTTQAAKPASGRLEHRLAAIAAQHGLTARDETLRFLIDFTRALLQASSALGTASGGQLDLLSRRLAARTRLPTDVVRQLVRVAMAPEHRVSYRPHELAAFGARFGPEAAALLAEESEDKLDLPGFARRHGSADALLLLDALLESRASSNGIGRRALSALQATADALGIDGVLFGALLRKHDPRHASGEHRFELSAGRVNIGRAADCEVQLLDPQVAPHHALLVRSAGEWRVVDGGSGRATVLDGEAVASAPFALGQRLRIGPYTLWLAEDGATLVADDDRAFSALTLRGVKRTIIAKGEPRALLSDVSFTAAL